MTSDDVRWWTEKKLHIVNDESMDSGLAEFLRHVICIPITTTTSGVFNCLCLLCIVTMNGWMDYFSNCLGICSFKIKTP